MKARHGRQKAHEAVLPQTKPAVSSGMHSSVPATQLSSTGPLLGLSYYDLPSVQLGVLTQLRARIGELLPGHRHQEQPRTPMPVTCMSSPTPLVC